MSARSAALALALAGLAAPAVVSLASPANADAEPPRTVLIELFTSQGCSSCPPADRLLAELAGSRRVAGRHIEVIPLAFHVDYWDAIGWPDPFASPRWTGRQHAYARYFEEGRVYTPQLVVAGGRHAVGSSRERALALIGWAAGVAPRVALEARVEARGDQLALTVAATRIDTGGAAPKVFAAVYDGGHSTPVGAGENARQTLHNERVVRHLEALFDLDAGGELRSRTVEIGIDPSWRRGAIGVVVFAQDPASGAILGAATATMPPA